MDYRRIIKIEAGKRGGNPCVRKLRYCIVSTFKTETEVISVDDIIRRILEATPKGEASKVL